MNNSLLLIGLHGEYLSLTGVSADILYVLRAPFPEDRHKNILYSMMGVHFNRGSYSIE